MSVTHIDTRICQQYEFHLSHFDTPIARTNMEPTAHWSQTKQIVKCVSLVVIKHDNLVLEHSLDIFFSVKVKPVFQTQSRELMEHLLLFKEVDILSLLRIAFGIDSNKLEQKVLTNLSHGRGHVNLSFKLRVHGQKWSTVKLLESGYKDNLEVFDCQNVEVTQIKFSGTTIDEKLTINLLVKGCTVWSLCFW